jgi:hypothetical protein
MKKTFLVFVVGIGLMACGDSSSNNGGTLDSNVTAPTDNTIDNSTTQPDTSVMDANSDSLHLRGAGTGSGQSSTTPGVTDQSNGASTNSNNSGSATDDTRGSK